MREIEITWGANRDLVARLSGSGGRFFVFGGTATRFYAPGRREPNDLSLLLQPEALALVGPHRRKRATNWRSAPAAIASAATIAAPTARWRSCRVAAMQRKVRRKAA